MKFRIPSPLRGALLSLLVASAVVLGACGGGGNTPTPETEAQNPEPPLEVDIGLFSSGNMEELREFIDTSTQFISRNPHDVPAYLKRGLTYSKIGEYEKAIQDFDEVIRLDPHSAEAYLGRGIAYFSLGQRQRLLTTLTKPFT